VERCGGAIEAADDNVIRRMRFAYQINKATHTLRIGNTEGFPTATIVSRRRLNITLDVVSLFLTFCILFYI
jgi:hypothetical protein